MNRLCLFLPAMAVLTLTACRSHVRIVVTNPSGVSRSGELAEVPLSRLGRAATQLEKGVSLTDGKGHTVPAQVTHDSLLVFPVSLGAGERFLSLFRIMIGEFYSARRNRVSVLDSLLSALLEMLSSEIGVSGTQFYPFLSLREEVFRFPEKPWNVTDAAKQMCLSGGHFQVLYKRYFSTTFLSDVIASRVQAAEELLLSTDESVSAIAERCGYLNEEHFIRQFRKMKGTTPHRFRLNAGERK